MLDSWPATAPDSPRTVTVVWHPTASPADIISGAAADGIDLTGHVSAITQTSASMDITLRFSEALASVVKTGPCGDYTITGPSPGQWMEVFCNGSPLWRGMVYTVTDYTEARGIRQMRVDVKRRDQSDLFRGIHTIGQAYATGAQFDRIATDICNICGLSQNEYSFSNLGLSVTQENTQFADMTPWDMLSNLLLPCFMEPWTNAAGQVTHISRKVDGASAKIYPKESIVSVNLGRRRFPYTAAKLSWTDPMLTVAWQQSQALGTATITSGFFQLKQTKDIFFSSDYTQRAALTYLKVRQSANSGLIPFCTEKWTQRNAYYGTIEVDTSVFAPLLATAELAGLLASSSIPDDVIVGGFIASEGITIPIGRVVQAALNGAIMLTVMSLGTGMYEVWGYPYNWIHAKNVTEAYDQGAEVWALSRYEFSCDLVTGEAHAQALAVNELKYQSFSQSSSTVVMRDDMNLEKGDIIELYNGLRFYVVDYSRDLSRGAAATVTVTCFKVP